MKPLFPVLAVALLFHTGWAGDEQKGEPPKVDAVVDAKRSSDGDGKKAAAAREPGAVAERPTPTQIATIHEDLENLKTQLRLYAIRNRGFPSTEQGLKALVERPLDQPIPRQWRRLLADVPKDPWNHEYRFEVPPTRSRDDYDLISAGPDGKFGTADDLGNW